MRVNRSAIQRAVLPLAMCAFLACAAEEGEMEGEAAGETESAAQTSETSQDMQADENIQAESGSLVPVGSVLTMTLDQELDVSEVEVGQAVSATVSEPLSSGGQVLVPAGAKVRGEVTAVQRASESEQDVDVLKVNFDELEAEGGTYPLDSELVEANPVMEGETSTGEAIAKVAAGTAAGAILGRIIGGDETGTFIGAAVGAAAGTAIVLGTQDKKAVLPEGSTVRVRVESPVRLSV